VNYLFPGEFLVNPSRSVISGDALCKGNEGNDYRSPQGYNIFKIRILFEGYENCFSILISLKQCHKNSVTVFLLLQKNPEKIRMMKKNYE
jgi:hypothetical protein